MVFFYLFNILFVYFMLYNHYKVIVCEKWKKKFNDFVDNYFNVNYFFNL